MINIKRDGKGELVKQGRKPYNNGCIHALVGGKVPKVKVHCDVHPPGQNRSANLKEDKNYGGNLFYIIMKTMGRKLSCSIRYFVELG